MKFPKIKPLYLIAAVALFVLWILSKSAATVVDAVKKAKVPPGAGQGVDTMFGTQPQVPKSKPKVASTSKPWQPDLKVVQGGLTWVDADAPRNWVMK